MGLNAFDPARIGKGYTFEPVSVDKAEYKRIMAFLKDAVKNVILRTST